MKAVIYARYSSDNQREESIEGQIRECTAFAEKNGIARKITLPLFAAISTGPCPPKRITGLTSSG